MRKDIVGLVQRLQSKPPKRKLNHVLQHSCEIETYSRVGFPRPDQAPGTSMDGTSGGLVLITSTVGALPLCQHVINTRFLLSTRSVPAVMDCVCLLTRASSLSALSWCCQSAPCSCLASTRSKSSNQGVDFLAAAFNAVALNVSWEVDASWSLRLEPNTWWIREISSPFTAESDDVSLCQ